MLGEKKSLSQIAIGENIVLSCRIFPSLINSIMTIENEMAQDIETEERKN